MKYLVIPALLLLVLWLVKRKITNRIRRARGEEIPPEPAIRPITVISGAILVIYGGYMLWYLIGHGYASVAGP